MKVHTLTIWNNADGQGLTSLHTTEQGAKQRLANFAYRHWNHERLVAPSGDLDEDIISFFDEMDDQYYYDLEEKTVYGPEVAEEELPAPDEIVLDPSEVMATILTLEYTKDSLHHLATLADTLGIPRQTAKVLVRDVVAKLQK